jgi:hypothetical protein
MITSGAAPATAAFGMPYSYTLAVTASPAATLTASGLPADGWLTFDAGTGLLSGTPGVSDVGKTGVITLKASNSLAPDATTSFTIAVTSPFPFAGEYAVSAGGSPPSTLASIAQNGGTLTLREFSSITAAITDATRILVNGADTATYGNSSIVFPTGTFAGQTWTKLDLPSNFTNQAGARVHCIEIGSAVTFIDRNGLQSPGDWISPTQLSGYGETVTVGNGNSRGQLFWADGTVWYENPLLTGTENGAAVTSIVAAPSRLIVTDYLTGANKAVSTVQNGTPNIVFVDSVGSMVLGTYSNTNGSQATTPGYPGYTATIVGRTIIWTDGNPLDTVLWTQTTPAAATVAISDYTNQNAVPVHIIQNGTNVFVIVDGQGNTSLGHFLTITTGVADSYPTDVATFNGKFQNGTSKVTWSDGIFVWTQAANPPLLITATDQHGIKSQLAFQNATMLTGLYGALNGVTGTRVNDQIEWSNGDIWSNFDFNALNALFEMGTGFP